TSSVPSTLQQDERQIWLQKEREEKEKEKQQQRLKEKQLKEWRLERMQLSERLRMFD
ncbi:MAG: hypothetical protein EZS28_054096, partial [Streblomastix strix]